ncbi:hypothetical protein ACFQU2_35990 [Siccirubricoccus deserti]
MSGAVSPLALALVGLGGAVGSVLRYLVAVQGCCGSAHISHGARWR